MNVNWVDVKTSITAMKRDVERDYLLRRYQKIVVGDLPWEEKLWDNTRTYYEVFTASWRSFAKRALDLSVAAIGVLLVAPVMLRPRALRSNARGAARQALQDVQIPHDAPGRRTRDRARVGEAGRSPYYARGQLS
jgi:hypothetical protein